MSRAARALPIDAVPGHLDRSRLDPLTLVMGGVLLLYVWRIQEVYPILAPFKLTPLATVAAILLFALDSSPLRRLAHCTHPLFRPVLVIFVLATLSVPGSLHVGASFAFLTSNFIKTVLLAGILVASVRDRRDVDRLIRMFVMGGVIYVLASISAGASDGGRLAGRGSYDPNDLGLFTVSTLPLCVYLVRRGAPTSDRLLGGIGAAALLFTTVQTGSRGGFLGLLTVGAFGLFALDSVRSSKRLTVAVLAVVAILGTANETYWTRMSTLLNPQEDYNWSGGAESGRVEVWKRGMGYMLRHPVLGVGVDQFDIAEGTMAPQAARQALGIGFKWSTAHSSYVQIGAELGVIGFVAFIGLLAMAFREAWRIGRTAVAPSDRLLGQAFAALVVGFAVGGAFLSQAYATYLYFSLSMLIGFGRVVQRNPSGAARISAAAPMLPGRLPPRAIVARRRPGSRARTAARLWTRLRDGGPCPQSPA